MVGVGVVAVAAGQRQIGGACLVEHDGVDLQRLAPVRGSTVEDEVDAAVGGATEGPLVDEQLRSAPVLLQGRQTGSSQPRVPPRSTVIVAHQALDALVVVWPSRSGSLVSPPATNSDALPWCTRTIWSSSWAFADAHAGTTAPDGWSKGPAARRAGPVRSAAARGTHRGAGTAARSTSGAHGSRPDTRCRWCAAGPRRWPSARAAPLGRAAGGRGAGAMTTAGSYAPATATTIAASKGHSHKVRL